MTENKDHSEVTLDVATINDILNELARRYEGVLIVYTGDAMEGTQHEKTEVGYRGGFIRALGLATYVYNTLFQYGKAKK